MKKAKKPTLSLGEKLKNKKIYICILLVSLLVLGIYVYKTNNKELKANKIYYTGDIYSANHAANMLDYMDEGNNIIFSPLNVNSSLAILYNGTDNNSNKELKKYFKKSPEKLNAEMNIKLNSLKETEYLDNKYDKLYKDLINELYNKSYDTLTNSTIALLTKEQKEELLLLLRKIQITKETLNKTKNISIKNIQNYSLTSKELEYNDYTIKEILDDVISEYETYNVKNKVESNTNITVDNYDEEHIEKEFKENTSMYTYQISSSIDQSRSTTRDVTYEEEITEVNIKNNLNFNYSWENAFHRNNINDAEFYNIDNNVQAVEMMYAIEKTYLENNQAKGFKYDFENGKYSFVGILPKKEGNFTLSEFNLDSFLLSKKQGNTLIGVPKMNYNSEIDLKELVSNYEVKEIFTKSANFSRATERKIVINEMIQKNELIIAEKGTSKSSLRQTESVKFDEDLYEEEIILNRPYAYLIINNETEDILFIGKVVRINHSS